MNRKRFADKSVTLLKRQTKHRKYTGLFSSSDASVSNVESTTNEPTEKKKLTKKNDGFIPGRHTRDTLADAAHVAGKDRQTARETR